jgi:Tfp pilus assembly protein PilN
MIEINLLPKEYRKRGNVLSFDKRIIYVGVVAAALVVVMGGLTIFQRQELSAINRMISKARMEENRYRKDIAIIDALTEVKAKILARVDAIEKLDHRRSFYISLLEDLNSRLPEFLWMTSFSETPTGGVAVAATQPGRSQPGTTAAKTPETEAQKLAAATPQTGSAVIEGYAYSLNAVGSFLIGLVKSDYFKNVKLSRAVAEEIGSVTAFNFKVSCDLNYEAQPIIDELQDTEEGLQISVNAGHEHDSYDRQDYVGDYEEQ